MAGQDYVPTFLPAFQLSCLAGAAITAGQVVFVSGNTFPVPTVSPTTAATAQQCGVAANTVASGSPVDVYFVGVHNLAASGAIVAGDPVTSAAGGAVADLGTPASDSAATTVIGHALNTASGGFVQVFLNP